MNTAKDGGIQIANWFFKTDLWRKGSPALRSIILTIIQKASYKDDIWEGIPIKPGQLPCSLRNLANDCNVRINTLRYYLAMLDLAHFTTRNTTHRITIITILKYSDLRDFFPKEAHNFPHISPHKVYQSGSGSLAAAVSNGKQINNKNEQLSSNQVKDLKEENFDPNEAESLRSLFGSPERISEHLTTRGFTEDAVKAIIEHHFTSPVLQEATA